MIQIKFNSKHRKRLYDTIRKVYNGAKVESEKLNQRCAIRYSYKVRSNLMSQKYGGSYIPLSKHYVRKKVNVGAPAGFWRYSDTLQSSITVFRVIMADGSAWAGGVPPETYNEKGDDVTMYGLILEGMIASPKIPARPLFTPTLQDFKKQEYKEEVNRTIRNLRKYWR